MYVGCFEIKQIYNFLRLCELLLITCTQLKTIHLTTGFDDVRCILMFIVENNFQLITGSQIPVILRLFPVHICSAGLVTSKSNALQLLVTS